MEHADYHENVVQRALRLWTTRHPWWPWWVCALLVAVILIFFAVAIMGDASVYVVGVFVIPMAIVLSIISAVGRYAEEQVERFDQQLSRLEQKLNARRHMQIEAGLCVPTDPDLTEEEFYRALIAILTVLHSRPTNLELEAIIANTLALAYCDDETFQQELLRAGLC